jgi:hypothetical protein
LRGERSSLENREQKLEGKMEGRKKEGRKDIRTDGTSRWTVGMDRVMEQRDGQTGWAYGRKQMDGKDEERMDEFFSSSFFSFFYLIFPSLCSLTQIRTHHTPYLSPLFTFTYYFYFILSFELALSFHSLACSRGGGCYGYGYLTDTSATLYLVPLFTFIYLQTFHPLPSSSTSILLLCNRTRSNVLGELKG